MEEFANPEVTVDNDLLTEEEQELLNRTIAELDGYENTIENIEPSDDSTDDSSVETTDENNESNTVVTHRLIPENSRTVLVNEYNARYSSAPWFDLMRGKVILIAGLGGIGSWTTLLVSRLSPSAIRVYDNDTVESTNIGGQFHRRNDIGKHKAVAVRDSILDYSCFYDCYSYTSMYQPESSVEDIMICGFDNMKSRKVFFNNWLERVTRNSDIRRKHMLYIDGRLSVEEFQIFCIRGDDNYNILRYKNEFLFDDDMAEEPICSYKQTSYCAAMIASFITNLLVNFTVNEDEEIRDLPFFTSYNASLMYLKTEN